MDSIATGSSEADTLLETIVSTFLASVKSVGTACTLAGVGIYLHQKGFVVGNGKRTLALISQQVTIPLLFFTKILYCNQNWSSDTCPNVTDSLKDVWILLVWPIWVCTAGLLVGYGITKLASNVPNHQRNSIMVAVAFGNSTGLPITLLTVIHTNFGSSGALGTIDPTLFLSVYLVMYPVLQWGIGGFLLAPASSSSSSSSSSSNDKKTSKSIDTTDHNNNIDTSSKGTISMSDTEDYEDTNSNEGGGDDANNTLMITTPTESSSLKSKLAHNVVNRKVDMSEAYQITHRGLDSLDGSMYLSIQEKLDKWGKPMACNYGSTSTSSSDNSMNSSNGSDADTNNNETTTIRPIRTESYASIGMDLSNRENIIDEEENDDDDDHNDEERQHLIVNVNDTIKQQRQHHEDHHDEEIARAVAFKGGSNKLPSTRSTTSVQSILSAVVGDDNVFVNEVKQEQLIETIKMVVQRCLQPPVIAALMGLLFASLPTLRGILVDIEDRSGSAPLQWFFDGLYSVGQAAVPINMIILGCNLSASYMLEELPKKTNTKKSRRSSSSSNTANKNHTTTTTTQQTTSSSQFFSNQVSLYVVIGKMVVMPIVGVVSTLILREVYRDVPTEFAGGLYLVLLIVFLCPTANNVMVMVELASGSGGNTSSSASPKEGMARIIAYQYAVAPILLSGTVTCAVLMATHMTTPLF